MIKYSVKRKRKHNVKQKKGFPTECSSFSSSMCNNEIGRLVWGKIPGSRIWPGIIVDHMTCGMPPPSEKNLWIFWFGDQRLSLGTETKTYDFIPFFKRFYPFGSSPTTFKKGIFSILVECRKRAGLSAEENPQNFTEYEKWALEGFTNPSKSFDIFLPSKGMSLPGKVLKQLSRIKLIQKENSEESKNEQKTLDHFLISSDNDSDTESLKIVKQKAKLLKEVKDGVLSLESVCLGCDRVDEQEALTPHPMFQGSLCQHCKDEVHTSTNGTEDLFCAVCSRPGEMFVCDQINCNKIFCLGCVELLVAPSAIKRIRNTDPWSCFLCAKYDPDTHGLLVPRAEWLNQRESFENSGDDYFPEDDSPEDEDIRRPLRVLSLFDGIGTGLFVLEKLNMKVEEYFASEMDQDAMNVARMNFGSKVTHIGSIQHLTKEKIQKLCPIDLLLGGSSCSDNGFSNQPKKQDTTGTGISFFHFFRIQKVLEKCNGVNRRLFWLFENVSSMSKEFKKQIDIFLERKPKLIGAQHFSPHKTPRFYWGNIPGMYKEIPMEVFSQKNFSSSMNITECDNRAIVDERNEVTSNLLSLLQSKGMDFAITKKDMQDVPWITELEKIM